VKKCEEFITISRAVIEGVYNIIPTIPMGLHSIEAIDTTTLLLPLSLVLFTKTLVHPPLVDSVEPPALLEARHGSTYC
jgi:hypothetical protein